jgi:hypothetical protein
VSVLVRIHDLDNASLHESCDEVYCNRYVGLLGPTYSVAQPVDISPARARSARHADSAAHDLKGDAQHALWGVERMLLAGAANTRPSRSLSMRPQTLCAGKSPFSPKINSSAIPKRLEADPSSHAGHDRAAQARSEASSLDMLSGESPP